MAILSSFEVLAQSLIPPSAIPGGGGIQAKIPFVLQAYFVEVSLPKSAANPVSFSLDFQETTQFQQGAGPKALMAQYIDADGEVVMDKNFASDFSFKGQQLKPGQTIIYSIQVVGDDNQPTPNSQAGTGWRGITILNAPENCGLVASPTHRQIYFTSDDQAKASIADSTFYPVPTASGKTLF